MDSLSDSACLMRFTITTLLALGTITAVFLSLIWTHPVSALAVVSLYFALSTLVDYVQLGDTGTRKLAGVTALAAFGSMMFFGLATIAAWIVHSWFTSGEMRLHMAAYPGYYFGYVLKFVFVYGLAAGVSGGALGALASIGLSLLADRDPDGG